LIRLTWVALLLLSGLAVWLPGSLSVWSDAGPADAGWLHRDRLLSPTLLRYYRFSGGSSLQRTANLVGWTGALVPPAGVQDAVLVRAALSGDHAVRLDENPLEAVPVQLPAGGTIELRFRHLGPGKQPGPNVAESATLAACGDGVWSGFRLCVHYPCNLLTFELGRPKPQQPVMVTSALRIPVEAWVHVVATWDRQTVKLYVNGLPAGQTAYAGPWFQVRASSRLRLGFVGNGYGSTRFDTEEFLIWNRALTAAEVLAASLRLGGNSHPQQQQLIAAAQDMQAGKSEQAIGSLEALSDGLVPDGLQQAAVFLLAENQRRSGQSARAERRYRQLCETVDGTAFSRLALHQMVCLQQQVTGLDGDMRFCGQNLPYDQAMTEYRRELDERDTSRWRQTWESDIRPLVQTHCVACHHAGQQALPDLASLTDGWSAVDARSTFWARVAEQVQSGSMPPRENTALSVNEKTAVLQWIDDLPVRGLCEQIASDETERWYTGAVQARHLTRLEFRNAVRDLLGVTVAEDRLPPADGAGGEGFDTSAGTLFTSVSHFEAWLQSVSFAVDQALAGPAASDAALRLPQAEPDTRKITELLSDFAQQAWRRALQPTELDQIRAFVADEQTAGQPAQEVLRLGLNWVLLSPKFLFVSEQPPAAAGDYRLNSWELATRLALFLWSSVPDRELLQAAAGGRLTEPAVLRQQLQRMLASSKAEALGEGFGLQWLGLQTLDERQKSSELFAEFSPQIRQLQRREAILFVSDVLRSNRPLTDLFTTNEVWANEPLARFYGLPAEGLTQHFTRLEAEGQTRAGAATLGAVLVTTAYPARTSPVLRGKWILEQFLGESVLPPPASVPSLDADSTAGLLTAATLRQRLQVHRADEECAACHQTMDQLGFCLETFDAVGRYRGSDGGQPVDDSAELPDGTRFAGPAGLKQYLLTQQDAFCRQFARRLLGHAIGRPVDKFDECVVDSAVRKLQNSEYRAGVLLEHIVLSYAFQHRYSAGGGTQPQPTAGP
jgi:mono/diheme cytochrome c family protein